MAVLQSKTITGSFNTSLVLAYTSNTTAGSLLTAATGNDGAIAPTFSDSQTNTWSSAIALDSAGVRTEIRHVANCPGGACTVTAGFGTGAACTLDIAETSGVATASPLDKTATGSGFGTAATTAATATISQADEIIFVATCREFTGGVGTFTPGTNYTELQDPGTDPRPTHLEYRIVSSVATYAGAATLDATENWTEVLATYKLAAGGAVANAVRRITRPFASKPSASQGRGRFS